MSDGSGAESEDDTLEENYYSILNVGKNATKEEINAAFRQLSRLYHPDRHTDPKRKKKAEMLFDKAKKAHEVLCDPHRRAIYDTMGVKGLETDGWEIVQRTKTPQEIREEYERLAQEREERRLNQRTNPKGSMSVGIDATELFSPYDPYHYDAEYSIPTIELSSLSISQSVDCPLTTSDTATLMGSLATQNGTGGGSFGLNFRRILDAKSWSELELSAGDGGVGTIRYFRNLGPRMHLQMSGMLQMTPVGLRPGFNASLMRQLDKNVHGTITWKTGSQSSLSTNLVYDTERNHFSLVAQLGVPTSFLSANLVHKIPDHDLKLKALFKYGTMGAVLAYGAEKQITGNSALDFAVNVAFPQGVSVKIRLARANQNYIFQVMLADFVSPSAIFYGTIVPIAVYNIARVLVVNPYLKQRKDKELKRKQEGQSEQLVRVKKEAQMAVELMTESVAKVVREEEAKRGLIILRAIYGKFVSDEFEEGKCIDVTIPIQYQVKDSKLQILTEGSKSSLPGFYDPCIGEEKSLYIKYRFQNRLHEVTVNDKDRVMVPKQRDRLDKRPPGDGMDSRPSDSSKS